MTWLFEPGVRVRRGGNTAAYAFRPLLDVFVREVLQNAKDQKLAQIDQARVHFGLIELSGKPLGDFLKALGWNELEPHIVAGANQSQHAMYLKRGVESLKERKKLLLLRIDDFGTGGLVGGDLERNKPFASLCIDELFSTKESPGGAGGSYGLGKSVLWRFSALSTVIFASHLQPKAYQKGQKGLRLFGRTQLPWHSIDDEDFDGPCWFGEKSEDDGREIALSYWDPKSKDLAKQLYLDRPDSPGTSILIVGFKPPAEEAVHPEELTTRFCAAASKHFWPVVCGDSPVLTVTSDVRDIDGRKKSKILTAGLTEEIKPFVACLSAHRNGDTKSTIEKDTDVAAVDIPFVVPAALNGDPPVNATVTLCVKLAPRVKGLVNNVAYTRGFGMVVRYRDLNGFSLSAQDFVAVLLGGTMRGSTPGDDAVERFLRLSEPPEHDTWTANQRLQANYKKGYATVLEQLDKQVLSILKELVSEAAEEGERGPQLLSKMFPIGSAGIEKRLHPFSVTKRAAALTQTGAWLFSGEIERNSGEGPWSARVALRFGTDEGAEVSVVQTLKKISPKGATFKIENGEALVDLPANIDKLSFEGVSDPRIHPVEARRAAVQLLIRAGLKDEAK